MVKNFSYTLCDLEEPFEIERFIDAIKTILSRFKINFAMGYILWTPTNVKYYHPCSNNGCLWKSAFDVSSDTDLNRFKTEFEKGNWLLLNSHLIVRSNTKSVVECLANICFTYIL